MASYLIIIFSTSMKVIQKYLHHLILSVSVSYWNWQSLCIFKYLDIIHCWPPYFMCYVLENSGIPTFSEKVMLEQYDWIFSINFIPSPGNSAINLLLWTSTLARKRFLIAFFTKYLIFSLLFLDNLGVLHKFLCTEKNLL